MKRLTICTLLLIICTPLGCDRDQPKPRERQKQSPKAAAKAETAPAPVATQAGPWYEDLTPPEALEKAREQNRTVFIAVYRRDDQASTMADTTLFQSEQVRRLLARRTVPIRIFIEDNRLFALGFRIESVPTFLFLRPDGSEIDRLGPVTQPEGFLAIAREYIAGHDSLNVAVRAAIPARQQLAAALLNKGRHEEGLAELLWLFDRCAEFPDLFDTQGRTALAMLSRLARVHDSAGEELTSRCAAARERLISGAARPTDFRLLVAVNDMRARPAESLELFAKLRDTRPSPERLEQWTREVLPALLAAGRYDEIAAGLDPERAAARALEELTADEPQRDEYRSERQWRQAQGEHRQTVAPALCPYYQALLGLERYDAARSLAEQVQKIDAGAQTLNALAWAGYLSGHPTDENVQQAREAHRISHGNNAGIIDTLARVLAARQQRDEAVELLNGGIKHMNNEADRKLLQNCLGEIQGGA